MKTTKILVFCFFLCTSCMLHAQSAAGYKKQILAINTKIAAAYIMHDEKTLLGYYLPDVIVMPEYHQPLYGKNLVARYFSNWFAGTTTKNYGRRIVEVQKIGDYLSEIGTFTHTFEKRDGSSFTYFGKYMNIWKINPGNEILLVSEIWGSDVPIDAKVFAFVKTQTTQSNPETDNNTITTEVARRNALISDLVRARKGEQHAADIFSHDAIYLTYDTSMLIGMQQIKPYFMEHEKPDAISIDSISIRASKIIDLGNYVIEYGYYYVDVSWDNKKAGIKVTGKSTNLWKRNDKGVLMMFRQMVNHD